MRPSFTAPLGGELRRPFPRWSFVGSSRRASFWLGLPKSAHPDAKLQALIASPQNPTLSLLLLTIAQRSVNGCLSRPRAKLGIVEAGPPGGLGKHNDCQKTSIGHSPFSTAGPLAGTASWERRLRAGGTAGLCFPAKVTLRVCGNPQETKR